MSLTIRISVVASRIIASYVTVTDESSELAAVEAALHFVTNAALFLYWPIFVICLVLFLSLKRFLSFH
jgi:hypothetical protein